MKKNHIPISLVLVWVLSLAMCARSLPTTTLPFLSTSNLGWSALFSVESTLDTLSSFTPTTIAVKEAVYVSGFEPSIIPMNMPWSERQSDGNWTNQFSGYGTVGVVSTPNGDVMQLAPATSTPTTAHSALMTSVASFGDLTVTITGITLQQTGPEPTPWESAWFLWHYTDDAHFYALTLQSNGWELSKEDPAYPGNQRFLLTQPLPTYPIGSQNTVTIKQKGNTIELTVNGVKLGSFTDTENPYISGNVGLYCEESTAQFSSVVVNGSTIPW